MLCLVLVGVLLVETICQQKGQGLLVYASAQTEEQTVTDESGSAESATKETSQTESVTAEGTESEKTTEGPAEQQTEEEAQDAAAAMSPDTENGTVTDTEQIHTISGDNTGQRETQEKEERTVSEKVRVELTSEAGFAEKESVSVQVPEKERCKALKKSLNQKLEESSEKVKKIAFSVEASVTDQTNQEIRQDNPVTVRLYPEDENTQKALKEEQKSGTLRLCHLKEEGTEKEDWEFLEYELKEEVSDTGKKFYVEYTTESFSPFLFVTTEPKEELKAESHPVEEPPEAETQIAEEEMKADRAGGSLSIGALSLSLISGADKKDGKYVWTPEESTSRQQFAYSLDYSVSGELAAGKKALQIELPLHILKTRDGKWADTFECPYLALSEVSQGEEPDFVYEKDEANNKVTIYNYKDLTSGVAGFVEFAYTTNRSTFEYKDMEPSGRVTATVRATGEAEVTKTASEAPVYIDTQVSLTSSALQTPDRYTTWQSAWGAKPADADQYEYLVWTVQSDVREHNTSPYTFSLNAVFTELEGSVVGYRFSGQSSYTVQTEIPNQTGNGYRYDYVLTRLKKTAVEKVLENASSYTVTNKVTTAVIPSDGKDTASTVKTSRTYTYDKPVYRNPGNMVSFWTYGIARSGNYVQKEADISDYTLRELLEGEKESIDGLKYNAHMSVSPFNWTLEDGADGSYEDIIADKYGKKKVGYVFTDDSLYLNDSGNPLVDEDYDIRGITWTPKMYTATFDRDSMSFKTESVKQYDAADAVTIWVRTGAKESSDAWKQAAVYDMQTGTYRDVDTTLCSRASGNNISFLAGVKGVRMTCENAYYTTEISMTPQISLNGTHHVKTLIGNQIKVGLVNKVGLEITQNGATLYENTKTAKDYIKQVIPESYISKYVSQTRNDKRKQQLYVTWGVRVQETYKDNSGTNYIAQESGTFYDLLPKGGNIDLSSVKVWASGKALSDGSYQVEQIENYNDTGRTMLKVQVTEPTDTGYQLTYQTVHSYNAIQDYGKNLLNSVAYETGNEKIANGYPDNGGKLTEKDLMKNLDSGVTTDRFLYAEVRSSSILVSGNTGLSKQVKSKADTAYGQQITVTQGNDYSYQIRLANNKMIKTRDIVLFDSLENYYQESGQTTPVKASDWKGTLTGIDVSALRYLGISPKIYLSRMESLNLNDHHDLTEKIAGEAVWVDYDTFIREYGIEAARAVAVDASKKTDQTDYVLPQGKALTFTLYLKAPDQDNTGKEDPTAYNNVYVQNTMLSSLADKEHETPQFYRQDYTEAHYRIAGEVSLKKVDERDGQTPVGGATYLLRGTSDYGTEYQESRKTDRNGKISYQEIEKGTYELVETACSKDWLPDKEVYTVTIDETGNVTVTGLTKDDAGNYLLEETPRIHADLTFEKIDSITKNGVNGAEFLLTGTSKYGTDVSLQVASKGMIGSAEIGQVSFADLELGTYELTETKAKDGYIRNTTKWSVQVDERGVAVLRDEKDQEVGKTKAGTYQITNEPYHTVRFVKTSTYGEKNTLPGAEFRLDGVSDYGTNVSKTAASDQDGLVVIKGLEPGSYQLKETKAPEGHELSTATFSVQVQADGTFTIQGLDKITIGKAELYDFKNVKTTGTVKLTKVWVDQKTNAERTTIPDMTIMTKKPSKNPKGYTLTFDANGGTFANGETTNEVLYNTSGTKLEGTYQTPTSHPDGGTFAGWMLANGKKITFNGANDPEYELTEDTTLYAIYDGIKYAVSVYGIGVDTLTDGEAGLTFGPALGDNYANSFKWHAPFGNTTAGNKHRCIHNDTWTTIISWNKTDPYVYEECISEGCTHSVYLNANSTTTILSKQYTTNTGYYRADGTSALFQELKLNDSLYENLRYAPNGGVRAYPLWSESRVRAMLNGADSETDIGSDNYDSYDGAMSDVNKKASVYTKDNCLFKTFPSVLQDAIGTKVVKYDSDSRNITEENVKHTNDRLWLFSLSELSNRESPDTFFKHPLEGECYPKFSRAKRIDLSDPERSFSCLNLRLRESYGIMLRTRHGYYVYSIGSDGGGGLIASNSAKKGIAPGFTLKR